MRRRKVREWMRNGRTFGSVHSRSIQDFRAMINNNELTGLLPNMRLSEVWLHLRINLRGDVRAFAGHHVLNNTYAMFPLFNGPLRPYR
jgi:hypothetical protein